MGCICYVQVPEIDGRPWYEVAMMKSQPLSDPESQALPVLISKELLEDIGREIMALYVTRSHGELPC